MGRMHGNGKGISRSSLPYHRGRPSWFRKEIKEVEEQILKLARRGRMPSEIGLILRDEHGICKVKAHSLSLRILQLNLSY